MATITMGEYMAEWNVGQTQALASMLLMYERDQADIWLLIFKGDDCVELRAIEKGFPTDLTGIQYGFAMTPHFASANGDHS